MCDGLIDDDDVVVVVFAGCVSPRDRSGGDGMVSISNRSSNSSMRILDLVGGVLAAVLIMVSSS